MARKTAIRITNAELNAEEYRRVSAVDRRTATNPHASRNLLSSLADWRQARDRMTPTELLQLARSAARLEMRGAAYSAEDRADVASEIVRRLLMETGASMPRRESPKVTLTAFCDSARNLRRGLDRLRLRDAADQRRAAEEYALTAEAIGVQRDDTLAKHAAIVARYSEDGAERTVAAVAELLGVIAETDDPVWLTLYGWCTARTAEKVAEYREMSVSLVRKRQMIGAKFLRGFFSADDLAAKLTLGASESAETLTLVMADDSREAHGRTRRLAELAGAPHWREGTDAGTRAERPTDAASARDSCQISRQAVRPKRQRERAKRAETIEVLVNPRDGRTMVYTRTHGSVDAETARALARIARLSMLGTRRRERAVSATSDTSRAIRERCLDQRPPRDHRATTAHAAETPSNRERLGRTLGAARNNT